MVRGNGSAGVETGVKAATRPNAIPTTMRRGPLRDTLDDLSTMITFLCFARLGMRTAM
jgi:hypothetical protein